MARGAEIVDKENAIPGDLVINQYQKGITMNSTGRLNAQDNTLRPDNSALLLVDYQALILLSIQSRDRAQLTQNIVGLARAARAFEVPVLLTTMAATGFGGPLLPELRDIFPDITVNTRTAINPWDDEHFLNSVKDLRRKKLIIAGLWTELSLALPVLSAVDDGYSVYFVADTSGGVSEKTHQIACQQLIQAGARPRTWQQLMFSWQRDWTCLETVEAVQDIIRLHGSAFPPSAIYAKNLAMRGEEARVLQAPRRGLRPADMAR